MGFNNFLVNKPRKKIDIVTGENRKDIYPGLEVDIVLKKDQPTGKLTRGIVQDLLTSKSFHPRGIKVRLEDGQVGRVQNIVNTEKDIQDTVNRILDSEYRDVLPKGRGKPDHG